MGITYDPEANAVYIEFPRACVIECMDVEEGVTAALDVDGHVVGLEILDARKRLGSNPLAVSLEQLSRPKSSDVSRRALGHPVSRPLRRARTHTAPS